jgi:carbon starvation protein
VLAWGYFLYAGVNDPLGGINQLFPLFGIANQLLAAVALAVCTTLLIKHGKVKWAWVTGVPLAWDAVVTLTASYQKVFSDNPKIGFFSQRDTFSAAIDDGKVLPPAKSMDDMHQVVTNSTVDGILAALFAAMIIIVLLDSARIWFSVIVARRPVTTTETPFVESKLWAPSGLIPTAEERAVMAGATTNGDGSVGGDRFTRSDRERVGSGRRE